MNSTRTQNSIRNASNEVALRLLTALGKFILRTVFIKTLGIQYNGVSGLFTDILTVFSLAELGINKAIAFALFKPLAENDEQTIERLMNFYKKIYRVIAGVIMAAGVILLPFLRFIVKDVPDIKEDIRIIFILFVVQSASSYLFIYKATLLEANQQKHIVSKVNIVFTLIQLVVESALLLIFRQYLVYLVFSIATNIAKNYTVSVIAERKFPVLKRKSKGKLTKDESRRISRDIGALSLYKVSNVAVASTDSIVTSSIIGTVMVGVLSNYRLITNTLDTLLNQLFMSIVPSVGNLAVTETTDRQYALHKKLSFLMFALGNFVCVSLLVLLNPFIEDIWIGHEYAFSTPIVIAIVANFYLCMMQYPNTTFRTSNGLFVQGKYRPLAMAIINVALSIALALWLFRYGAQWGVFGILAATPVSRILTETWFDPFIIFKNVFKKPFRRYLITRFCYLVTVIVSCAGTYLLTCYVGFSNVYANFFFKVLCCAIIPNIVTVAVFVRTQVFKDSVALIFSAFKKRRTAKK